MNNDQMLSDLIATANAAKSVKDAADKRYKQATDAIVLYLGKGALGKHETESGSVTLSENNTYPMAEVAKRLKPGQIQRVRSNALDSKKVQALYPEIYAAVKSNNGVKVTLGK